MKFAKFAAAAIAAASLATAAHAADPAVGATVYGPEGNEVGTIAAVADGIVTLDTGKHKAALPVNAFGAGDQGPTITVTKAQLDGMMDQQVAAANAARDALIIVGTEVHTADHQVLGTIESIDADEIIVIREAGPITVLRDQFTAMDKMLMTVFTLEAIETALAQQAEAAAVEAAE